LSVDGEQLGDRVFERAAAVYGWTDSIDPAGGDGLDVFLTVEHESERIQWMTNSLEAMTGWFATTPMSEYERSGQSVGGDGKPGEQALFSAPQMGGVGASNHLIVIILSEQQQNNTHFECLNPMFEPNV
jgi:hypothetical protein